MSASRQCPALFISAPASNQGKTTVTAGIARYHRRRGLRVRVFKTGPDFLDPMILARASGEAVYSLHLWMVGEDGCRRLLYDAAQQADLILIEGVMGLFDGKPSGADLARTFGVPVLAVIDGQAMAQTFGAIAFGLARFQPDLPFHGVFANRIGTSGHAKLLSEALPDGVRWCGHMPTADELSLPDRHLGLTQADEIADLDARLDRAADAIAITPLATLPAPIAFDAVRSADEHDTERDADIRDTDDGDGDGGNGDNGGNGRDGGNGDNGGNGRDGGNTVSAGNAARSADLGDMSLAGKHIAVARDAAFSFLYPANLDWLREQGAAVRFFSPLADEAVPDDTDIVFLPGGYPELHARQLGRSMTTAASVRAHLQRQRALVAECGGMLYLLDTLQDGDGVSWPMLGLLPGHAAMQKKLASLGMHRLITQQGELRGHTFHYSTMMTPLTAAHTSQHATRGTTGEAVYRHGSIVATYFHAYWPSAPAAARAMLSGARL